MKNLAKIDRFYYLFGVALIILAAMVIITLRTIFSSLTLAGQVDEELFQASTPRINKTTIDTATAFVENKTIVPLDLGIDDFVIIEEEEEVNNL